MTPEQEKEYLLSRMLKTTTRAFMEFQSKMNYVTTTAKKIMTDDERKQFALSLAQRFTPIVQELAPDKKKETHGTDTTDTNDGEGNA